MSLTGEARKLPFSLNLLNCFLSLQQPCEQLNALATIDCTTSHEAVASAATALSLPISFNRALLSKMETQPSVTVGRGSGHEY